MGDFKWVPVGLLVVSQVLLAAVTIANPTVIWLPMMAFNTLSVAVILSDDDEE